MDQDLLAILACPKCKGSLTNSESPQGLCCVQCNVLYPIIQNVPVLLPEEALPLPVKTDTK